MNHFVLGVCLMMLACLLSLTACKPKSATPSHDTPIILSTDQVASVKMTRYQPSLTLAGTIKPHRSQQLHMPFDGKILYIAKTGTHHQAGNPLVQILPIHQSDIQTLATLKQYDAHSQSYQLMVDFDGTIDQQFVQAGDEVLAESTLLNVVDTKTLDMVSLAPVSIKSYLHIGTTVQLNTQNTQQGHFSGQISQIDEEQNLLKIHIRIKPKPNQAPLALGQSVYGSLDYGQSAVAGLVPYLAISNEQGKALSLTQFHPPRPALPVKGYIWLIKQDHTLHKKLVDVIEYRQASNQFLVTGVSEDSLVVTTPPNDALDGRTVRLH